MSTALVFGVVLSIWLSTNKGVVDLGVTEDSYCIS